MPRTLAFLMFLALAAPALAQSHTEAMARLAPFAGTYSLDGTAEIEDGTFDGSLTISPVLGGHFQQWDWEMQMHGESGSETVHLRFIATYDRASGTYTIHRFDSRDVDSPNRVSGSGPETLGQLRFDGDALVMAWPASNPDGSGQTGLFRNTVRLTAQGLHVETDVKPDGAAATLAIATTRANRR